jgi:acetyl-CoA acetyltransferase
MGVTAENLAREYGISREQQDAWALSSQHKARRLSIQGAFAMKSFRSPIHCRAAWRSGGYR